MDCKQFREILDCYTDHELSADAAAAADSHVRECHACARVAAKLETLRHAARQVVTAETPPPDLELRVRQSLRSVRPGLGAAGVGGRLALAAAAVFALLLTGGLVAREQVRQAVGTTLDRAIVRLSGASTVDLDGVVLCRDCELHRRYGVKAMCERIGHRGAIVTADGRIWNIVEQAGSAELVHDEALLGKRVRVRGRMFRGAGTIAVDTYQIL